MNPNEPSFADILDEFKRGGWIVGFLGGAGMLVRLILTDEKYSHFKWFGKVVAGTLVGIITYFALYGIDIAPIYKSVAYALSGTFSQELFGWLRRKFLHDTQ